LAQLQKEPHPAVAAAMAAWTRAGLTGLDRWWSTLPDSVATGAIPTQEQADEWARTHSLGMIDKFPGDLDDTVLVVLASALATRVTWLRPFQSVPAGELRGPWGQQLTRVLQSPTGGGHNCSIVTTQRAGTVAVHSALANDRLEVTSVIAEPGVARTEVLAAAHEIATARSAAGPLSTLSLFDLPLGESPLWTITEHDAVESGQQAQAILPAWHARSQHDLFAVLDLGFRAAAEALMAATQTRGPAKAAQSAAATYSRTGFEAAAVTALMTRASRRPTPSPGPHRTATLHFGHPYAVVATTHARGDNPWHGLPVFAAWITQPDETD
jgi:hypothetical protein